MDIKNKKIGIWGLGMVGTAALKFFSKYTKELWVTDQKPLSAEQINLLKQFDAEFIPYQQLPLFLEKNDLILASPGIDLSNYQEFRNKFISELDIFSHYFKKPIVAITGSVGKTTVTLFLTHLLLQQGVKAHIGGNIGFAMFDLLEKQNTIDIAVLEVSSFQLEYCKTFAPDLAILTNFYPNHLDRHKTIKNYFTAKTNIITNQTAKQKALIPWKLKQQIKTNASLHFICLKRPIKISLKQNESIFFIEKNKIIQQTTKNQQILATCTQLPPNTFKENWVLIIAALHLLRKKIILKNNHCIAPEHRLEKVAIKHQITFYNDSKSTLPASTLAAVNNLKGQDIQSIMLFLGGLSKGVDRTGLIKKIKSKVKRIYCFGKEADQLKTICDQFNILSYSFETLDIAFQACMAHAQSNDCILFSPAGSSFDLFDNYIHRGNYFKNLVKNFN